MADSDSEASSNENILTESFLHLEEIDVNLYRGANLFHPIGSRSVYGGQVVAHALRAAYTTVPVQHHVHSVHCYFLKGGSADTPILYHVDHTREGRTYCNRNVKAIQEGAPIFTMQASFKRVETDLYTHQYSMPKVPGPEGLLSSVEIMERQLKTDSVSARRKRYIKKKLTESVTYENRPVNEQYSYREEPLEAVSYNWVRALGHIGDDSKMHECVAVYLSDSILDVSLLPAGVYGKDSSQRMFVTSLDHSVWFHNPFRIDEWMLYEKESPHCGDGRAMTQGRLWKRDGTLAMSVAQEGVVRTFKSSL
ncbi:acyl-coenzyme A thioesterase 8-like [Haliotis rufescens]|uniref:acyl-coenzyme A thioesterase 8-like n=1 Tax=Haliotis rufescens TaxID=6454 RepID=UPI001EAFCAA5|nr:acyl-coenzyme A thioesterase 8-like [Haliotis rufescens]